MVNYLIFSSDFQMFIKASRFGSMQLTFLRKMKSNICIWKALTFIPDIEAFNTIQVSETF